MQVVTDEAQAKDVIAARQRISRRDRSIANIADAKARATQMTGGTAAVEPLNAFKEIKKIPLLIKCDVAGSAEAVQSAVEALERSDDSARCRADIVYCNLGDVTTSDVTNAAAFGAKIIAFNVGCDSNTQRLARNTNIDILHFGVIYEMLDELARLVSTELMPPLPGELKGKLLVKKLFKLGKNSKVAGCELLEGKIDTTCSVRVVRNERQVVHVGKIESLQVAKNVVSEVTSSGSECGLSLTDFPDLEEGDIVECFL